MLKKANIFFGSNSTPTETVTINIKLTAGQVVQIDLQKLAALIPLGQCCPGSRVTYFMYCKLQPCQLPTNIQSYYRLPTKLGEGNVFSHVCPSFCPQGVP